MKNNKMVKTIPIVVALVLLALVAGYLLLKPGRPAPEAKEEVVVYSGRHYGHVEPVFAKFTEETGIDVRFSFGETAELRERLKAEEGHTPADAYIAVDAGNLWLAAEEGLFQPVESQVLEQNIPAAMRDPQNRWFGMTMRVRTLMYNPDSVDPAELSTYEALADPKWQGRLVMRPATHVYTQSLVASLIAAHGEDRTEEIVRGWMANNPTMIDSDTKILETLAAGGGDVAIANHYYMGALLDDDPEFPVRVFWAAQENRGVHANVTGIGVTANARNRENAIKFLEWLSGPTGQRLFADGNFEFPVNPEVAPTPIIADFGDFNVDPIDMTEYGRLQADAIRLLDRAGYR